MKVLITYASAGAGHRKAAFALYDFIKAHRQDVTVIKLDMLDYASLPFKIFYSKIYIYIVSKYPKIWHFFYRLSFLYPNNALRLFADYLNCHSFIRYVNAQHFDIVFSMHFLTSSLSTIIQKKKLITIITDYTLHPFWIGRGVDTYVVSCAQVGQQLIKRGIHPNMIKEFGIPVGEKFYGFSNRINEAQKLGLNGTLFTVLIMTGEIGIGPIAQIVGNLHEHGFQLLVVCGKNFSLYNGLKRLNYRDVHIYPLVNNIDELISVADIVLTKAGGLTITECLVKKKPMVFFTSIPGLETANAARISEYKAGFNTETITDIENIICQLKDNPVFLRQTIDRICLLRKSNTLQEISNEI